jgi:WD40 repeat protein
MSSRMTRDIFDLLCVHLSWRDVIRVSNTCRKWRMVASNALCFQRLMVPVFGYRFVGGGGRETFVSRMERCVAQRQGQLRVSVRALENGQKCSVRCVAFASEDAEQLFVGFSKGPGLARYALNPGSNKLLTRYQMGSGKKVNCTAILPISETRVLCGASKPSNMAHLFDVSDGSLLSTYTQHNDTVFSLAYSNDRLCSGGGQNDNCAFVSDLESGTLLASLPCKGSVRGCDMTETLIYTASLDSYVRVWDLRSGKESFIRKLSGTCHAIRNVGSRILVTTGRPDCRLWGVDPRGGDTNQTILAQHRNGVSAMAVNSFNVACCDYDGRVSVTPFSRIFGDQESVPQLPESLFSRDVELHSIAMSPERIVTASDTPGSICY